MAQYSIGGHGNGEGSSNSNGIYVTLSDTDVLDCCICHEPLSPPIFQCINGHLSCSSCCDEIRNNCSMCSEPMDHIRCRAVEKVMESVNIACANAKYGCEEIVKYNRKEEHKKTCVFEPCFCPQTGCDFVHNYRELTFHFRTSHQFDGPPFKYDELFVISLRYDENTIVLQPLTDDKLFVIKNKVERLGNSVTLYHTGPSSLDQEFPFVMWARSHLGRRSDHHLLRSKVENIQGSTNASSSNSLLVPLEIFQPYGRLVLEIRIRKIYVA